MSALTEEKKTVFGIRKMKEAGERITMLTAFDALLAGYLDQAGIDIVLVGDSLGMVALGYPSTVPVTMDEMIHHARAVSRAVSRSLLVGDMPFLSYQVSIPDAIRNGGRFLKEAGCDAVKLEGGEEMAEVVAALTRAGIPVMGHIGLTPQTAGQLGGFRVQGRDAESARKLIRSARALEEAGVFALVLECIPDQLGRVITQELSVPTIGIGAGPFCDGQVLVTHDLLGMFERFVPRFVKQYARLAPEIRQAVESFRREVREGVFPEEGRGVTMKLSIEELLAQDDQAASGSETEE